MEALNQEQAIRNAREDSLVEAMRKYTRIHPFRYKLLQDYITPNNAAKFDRAKFERNKLKYFKKFPKGKAAYEEIIEKLKDIDKAFLVLLFRRVDSRITNLPADILRHLIKKLPTDDIVKFSSAYPHEQVIFRACQRLALEDNIKVLFETSSLEKNVEDQAELQSFRATVQKLLQTLNAKLQAIKEEDKQRLLDAVYGRLNNRITIEDSGDQSDWNWYGDESLLKDYINDLIARVRLNTDEVLPPYRQLLRILNDMRNDKVPGLALATSSVSRESSRIRICGTMTFGCKFLIFATVIAAMVVAGSTGVWAGVSKASKGYVDPDIAAGAGAAMLAVSFLGVAFALVQMTTGCAPTFADMRSSLARLLFFSRAENSGELAPLRSRVAAPEDAMERGEGEEQSINGDPVPATSTLDM